MKNSSVLSSIFFALAIGVVSYGCATKQTQTYAEPAAEIRAGIRFVGLSGYVMSYSDERCQDRKELVAKLRHAGWLVDPARQSRSLPDNREGDQTTFAEVFLHADRPFYGIFVGKAYGAYPVGGLCHVPFAFQPISGEVYEAYHQVIGRQCQVSIYKIALEPDKTYSRKPISFLPVDTKACLASNF